jgi:hypothetical protein
MQERSLANREQLLWAYLLLPVSLVKSFLILVSNFDPILTKIPRTGARIRRCRKGENEGMRNLLETRKERDVCNYKHEAGQMEIFS